ncbi:MAG: LysM peptidoglycan-binding domain-containing protein, partial [Acidimicrobiales bacterium]
MTPRNLLRLITAVLAVAAMAYAGQASFGSTSSGPQVYVVQPGDSLWSISQADGITMQALAAANGMQLS